jgi:hypothetical protein
LGAFKYLNMYNQKFFIYSIFLSIASLLFACYAILSKGAAVPAIAVVFNKTIAIKKSAVFERQSYQFWNNYPLITTLDEGVKLDSTLKFNTANGEIFRIKALASKPRPTIIFRYVNDITSDSILNLLHSYPQILVITDNNSPATMRFFTSNHGLTNQILSIDPDLLRLETEHLIMSYFFTIDSDLTVKNVFVPRTEIFQMTHKYLNYLSNTSNY